MKHQYKALDYAEPRARIALFMQMRLGKTLVLIRWAEQQGCKKILVLLPLATVGDWVKELQSELVADEDIVVLRGVPGERLDKTMLDANWFLATYESVLSLPEILEAGWDCVILDESTMIRNPKAAITKLLLRKKDLFNYRAVATGWPDPEDKLDYVTQMLWLYDSFMRAPDYWVFRSRFCQNFGYEWTMTKTTEQRVIDEVSKLAFFMTRKQAGIGSKKLYKTFEVEPTAEQIKLAQQIEDGFEFPAIHGSYGEDTKFVPVKDQWLGQVAGGFTPHGKMLSEAKTRQIVQLVRGELKDEKIVIWFHYECELQYVLHRLNEIGVKAVPFNGSTKEGAKEFTNGNAQVICAQARCGRFGLDWSVADTAIYYSNWYDGEIRAQSEDRIIHPKKKEPLLYIDLATRGSVDEDIISCVRQKMSRRQIMEVLAKRRMKA